MDQRWTRKVIYTRQERTRQVEPRRGVRPTSSHLRLLTVHRSDIWWTVSVAHWHSARSAWNGYQLGLGSVLRPGRI